MRNKIKYVGYNYLWCVFNTLALYTKYSTGVSKLISKKEVEHVAKLARLELTEDEKEKFTKQFSNILDYFNQLSEVNTENIEPMAHAIPMVNVMREDKAQLSYNREEILANAPLEEDGFFKVPRITE